MSRAICSRLLAWFRKNARDLPWRGGRNPYRIWISEVMLQQTQVATVIPYFERFLQRFPTMTDLAQADEHDVLRLWEGLGYYRRARDLCRAARLLREDNYATIPNDPDVLRALPGFGRYTLGAVLSQAYDRRVPILEANSERVLCRLFGVEGNPKDARVRKLLWHLAESLVPARSAGDFNQALMELGALVCTPAAPKCAACPLRAYCDARRRNRQHDIPPRAKPAKVVAVREVAVIVEKRGRLLLVQRPPEGRWPSLWEFPHGPPDENESPQAAANRLLRDLGLKGEVLGEVATIRHSVTRFRIVMTCLRVRYRGGTLRPRAYPNAVWIRFADLHEYPLSTPQRRLAATLSAQEALG